MGERLGAVRDASVFDALTRGDYLRDVAGDVWEVLSRHAPTGRRTVPAYTLRRNRDAWAVLFDKRQLATERFTMIDATGGETCS